MATKTTYTAIDVAKYFIYLASRNVVGDNQEREGITNLKLQKILYLAQAYFIAKMRRPLFSDKIEAWEFGPVVPDVYHELKHYKSTPIVDVNDKSKVSVQDKEVLSAVWDAFGGYSASKLVDVTHSHTPWRDAYKSFSKQITNKAIGEYYTPLLNE